MLNYCLIGIVLVTIIVKSKRSLHMLQQNLYNDGNRYLQWIIKHGREIFSIDLLLLMLTILITLLPLNETLYSIFLMLLILLYLLSIYHWHQVNVKASMEEKKPLVITARVKRLIVTLTFLHLLPLVMMIVFPHTSKVILVVYSALVAFNYLVVLFAKFCNRPIESLVYHHFYHRSQKKLREMSNLKVIGITGSYGKTSSKNILSDILNIKYNALPTPHNLNTEYGLMITINNYLDKFTDIFIAEMGAYKRGEIKTLCDMVHPKYGIITTIGTAHLESFGSEENIIKGKFELIESLPSDGIAVLNGDDSKQVNYPLKNSCKVLFTGIQNKDVDVHAANIVCGSHGTTFDVTFRGDPKKYSFTTKLLGYHNVSNILAALALGKEFGCSIKELQQGVKSVLPIEHRLELKKLGTFYQIDDAYNSNPVGAKGALDVLDMMPGLKVVVTPGMIELGEKEEYYNQTFGEQIAKVADYVVLIGKKQTEPIYNGLKLQGYDMDQVVIYHDVRDAYKFIQGLKSKEEIYALFENDLPDSYNE